MRMDDNMRMKAIKKDNKQKNKNKMHLMICYYWTTLWEMTKVLAHELIAINITKTCLFKHTEKFTTKKMKIFR